MVKRVMIVTSLVLCSVSQAPVRAADVAEAAVAADVPLPFYVYRNFHARENHFAPSGWMGDYGDLKFTDRWFFPNNKEDSVIKIEYTAEARQGAGWAGIYWQQPANNWGSKSGGFNLNGATKVIFKARGEKGGDTIDQFKIGGI